MSYHKDLETNLDQIESIVNYARENLAALPDEDTYHIDELRDRLAEARAAAESIDSMARSLPRCDVEDVVEQARDIERAAADLEVELSTLIDNL